MISPRSTKGDTIDKNGGLLISLGEDPLQGTTVPPNPIPQPRAGMPPELGITLWDSCSPLQSLSRASQFCTWWNLCSQSASVQNRIEEVLYNPSLAWPYLSSTPASLPISHLSWGLFQPLYPNTSLLVCRDAYIHESLWKRMALLSSDSRAQCAGEAGINLSRWGKSRRQASTLHQAPRAGSSIFGDPEVWFNRMWLWTFGPLLGAKWAFCPIRVVYVIVLFKLIKCSKV